MARAMFVASRAYPAVFLAEFLNLETGMGHRVHRAKHGAHREMPQEFARMNYHPAGEFKFADQLTTSVSPCSPSELSELWDEIDLPNLG